MFTGRKTCSKYFLTENKRIVHNYHKRKASVMKRRKIAKYVDGLSISSDHYWLMRVLCTMSVIGMLTYRSFKFVFFLPLGPYLFAQSV